MSEQCNESTPDRDDHIRRTDEQIGKVVLDMEHCPSCNPVDVLGDDWQRAVSACVAVVDDAVSALAGDQSVRLTVSIQYFGDGMFDVSYWRSAIEGAPPTQAD